LSFTVLLKHPNYELFMSSCNNNWLIQTSKSFRSLKSVEWENFIVFHTGINEFCHWHLFPQKAIQVVIIIIIVNAGPPHKISGVLVLSAY
jgi:hypothetical protein